MKLAKHQAGMGLISGTLLVGLIGFVGIFLLSVTPAYIEYFSVRSVIHGFKDDPVTYASTEGVRDAVRKRFDINNINKVSASQVVITPSGSDYSLLANYDQQVPFISNISLVVSFSVRGEAHGGSGYPQ